MNRNLRITGLAALVISCLFFYSFNVPDKNIKAPLQTENYFILPEDITQDDYIPNTIIFKLKEHNRNYAGLNSIQNERIQSALNQLNAPGVSKMFADAVKPELERTSYGEQYSDLSLIYIVSYSSGISIEKAVNIIYNTGEVEYAQPKYIQKLFYTPNDPLIGNSGQYFLTRIQAFAGWDIQKGDTNVTVGIVDSGSDLDHPDLAANLKKNWADPINGIDDDMNGYIDDFYGWDFAGADYNNVVGNNDPNCYGSNTNHGSHVSGDACAVTDNGVGVASPGFRCKFLPVKCSADNDFRGPGGVAYIITGYEGIKYAADMGCDVINCSWGSSAGGQFEQDVISYATINKNSLVVCAAGNDNSSSTFYPAGYKYVLSVASTTTTDSKSGFSNYGNTIDVCAPGSGIYSTLYNNTYANFSGTSMASPIAAGTAAIVKSQFPTYNAMQVGEKLRVTSDNIDGVNPSYAGMLGKGRINMFKALTMSSPAVRYTNYTVTDGNNNVPQPNDTLNIVVDFRNYLDPTSNLSVTLTTTSTAITMLNPNATLGAIPTLGNVSNTANPFRVRVNTNAPQNSAVNFKVNYTDGAYTDFEYFTVIVNPTYFNMDINKITTTINSRGNFGFNNYSNNTQGVGFLYNNGTNLLFEGGLMTGVSSSKVSDVVRGSNQSVQKNSFTNIIPFQITEPGIISNQDGSAKYNDDGAGGNKIGIEVSFNSFAWVAPVDEDYVIMRYRIKNTTAAPITNFYASLFADWDIGTNGDLNRADWDAVNQLGYIWRTDMNPSTYVGISLLSATNVHYWAIDNDNTVAGNPWGIYDGFTDNEKFQSMSSGLGRQQAGIPNGRDVAHVVGSGPYTIPVGQEIEVAFALIAGDNLVDLQLNSIAAKVKYNTILSITAFNPVVPERFSLSQNYPNPFNPVTNIKFDIPRSGNVTLKIFDLAGKEIAVLVNDNISAGSYVAEWDAANFASGVYFYKLEAEGYVDTKRMMLIK
jgi:serine protease